jgi:hypothetical protein
LETGLKIELFSRYMRVAGDALYGVRKVPTRVPSDDELELAAIDFLRQRFLRADERMAGLLATLERQIDAAPARERLSIRHAADEFAKIQQRLRAQVSSLPPSADECRKIMKSLLQVQGGALEQLSVLVEHNTRQEARIAHLARESSIKAHDVSRAGRGHARVERSPAGKAHATHRPLDTLPRRRAAIVELMRSHRLTVFAAIAVAGVYAYAHPPSVYRPQENGRDRPTPAAAGGSNDPPKYPASLADADDTTDHKSIPLSPGTIIARPSGSAAEAASLPTGDVKLQQLEESRDEPAKDAAHLDTRQARIPAAGDNQGSATSPVRKPMAPADNGEDRAVEPGPPRFVAVVFTHREPDSAIRAFAELQQRYPRLLARRKGEAQPVEIAEKGIWHRMVVLPAGPRQSADSLCDQLQAEGYDRCWVKPY